MVEVRAYNAFERSAFIYDSYIPRADYVEGARRLTSLIRKHNPRATSLLDVGCGSGKYLEALQHEFSCEGLDLSDGFLAIARKRCPDVPIHKANMIDFDLGCKFDAISCLFLAIAYVGKLESMKNALICMANHLNPGGVLFIEPWLYPQNFFENRFISEYVDEAERKIARMFIARREGNRSVYDIHYLVGTSQSIEYFIEREELSLFTHEEYLGAFGEAGLQVSYDKAAGLFDAHNIGMYWGKKDG